MKNKTNIIKKMNKQLFLNSLDTYFNTIKKYHGTPVVPGGIYIIKINKTLYVLYKLLYKFFYNYIKGIKNKINANNHMILSNIEYLKHDDMFVDFIYVLIYNRKEIFNTIIIITKNLNNFILKSMKCYYISSLKSILSFMVGYVYKNDIFYYITSKITLKHIRKLIRGVIHTVKIISGIFVSLCFYYNVYK